MRRHSAKIIHNWHPHMVSMHLLTLNHDEFDELSLQTSLESVFQSRLEEFYMKDCIIAAYMLDAAKFVTWNTGLTYQLPWDYPL
jgi:hypothetical protein